MMNNSDMFGGCSDTITNCNLDTIQQMKQIMEIVDVCQMMIIWKQDKKC